MAMSNEELAVLAKEEKVYAEILIRRNMGLVYTVAHQYNFPGVEFEDRVQEGAIGMFEAIKTFDPEKGLFSTHCIPWIRARILKYGNEQSNTIRLPSNIVALRIKIINYVKEMAATKGIRPTIEHIAEALDAKVDDVRHIVMINDSTIPSSLDTSAHNSDGDEVNAHELLGGKMLEVDIMRDNRLERLESIVNNLNGTGRYIASRVLGINGFPTTTFRELDGNVFNESGERMSITAINQRWLKIKEYLTQVFADNKTPRMNTMDEKRRLVVVVSKELQVVYVTASPMLSFYEGALESVLQNVDEVGEILRQDPNAVCVEVGQYMPDDLQAAMEDCLNDAVDMAEGFGGEVMCPEILETA